MPHGRGRCNPANVLIFPGAGTTIKAENLEIDATALAFPITVSCRFGTFGTAGFAGLPLILSIRFRTFCRFRRVWWRWFSLQHRH